MWQVGTGKQTQAVNIKQASTDFFHLRHNHKKSGLIYYTFLATISLQHNKQHFTNSMLEIIAILNIFNFLANIWPEKKTLKRQLSDFLGPQRGFL